MIKQRILIGILITMIAAFGITGTLTQAAWGGGGKVTATGVTCSGAAAMCKETSYNRQLWPDKYVGHDEPGVGFLSNTPGSGNRMAYTFTLPKDPSPTAPLTHGYTFETSAAFWFGMILCDTQGYPEQVHTCKADSDSNVTSLAKHPGSAYMEMQFYPPGWVTWPDGISCGAKVWCAALNVDSLSYDPLNDTSLDDACSNTAGGPEYVNFAFITKSGTAQAPANPIAGSSDTYVPNLKKDLLMSSGDKIHLQMFDTSGGLKIVVDDLTTKQSGSMTAGTANGFGQIQFATNPSVECHLIPYNFHPEYGTASNKTILPWGATQDNVEYVDEIGHFDWCQTQPGDNIPFNGNCPSDGFEGPKQNRASDYDDTNCFAAKASPLVKVAGCVGTNVPGWDGGSYAHIWPDGTSRTPGPLSFSSPSTGTKFNVGYQHAILETDLPDNESSVQCNVDNGKGCDVIPLADDGTPAAFYPFFSLIGKSGSCIWNLGQDIPGVTTNDFGKQSQYKPLFAYTRLKPGGHGATEVRYTAFRHTLATDPCAS